MQILYNYQMDFLEMLYLGLSSPQKALKQITSLGLKIQTAIDKKDIDSPEIAKIFLVVLNSVRFHIDGLDDNQAKLKFQELINARAEKKAQDEAADQIAN